MKINGDINIAVMNVTKAVATHSRVYYEPAKRPAPSHVNSVGRVIYRCHQCLSINDNRSHIFIEWEVTKINGLTRNFLTIFLTVNAKHNFTTASETHSQ